MNNGRKVIKARNYVGVIGFADGNHIEILPKVGSDDKERRRILTNMLRYVSDIPIEEDSPQGLEKNDSDLFEFMIEMFINEAIRVIKKGLNRNYHRYESNEPYLKGKILYTEDIKRNTVRNRFFVEYEVFDNDCPENRILKATLKKLLKCSHNDDNKREIRRTLENLSAVSDSSDPLSEFQRCLKSRNTMHYQMILKWCRLFLDNLGMDPFHGDNISFVFLFPMEIVYERFVAKMIADNLPEDWSITVQDTSKTLFDRNKVELRPDIVLRNGNMTIILDTKWKVADGEDKISMSDLQQMYVYSIKFKSIRTVLVYPDCVDVSYVDSDNGVRIESICFRPEDYTNSICSSIDYIEELTNITYTRP